MPHALAVLCAALTFTSVATFSASPAQAAVPGTQQTCKHNNGYATGTVRALPGGRTIDLSMSRADGYTPFTKKAETRVYSSAGALLWTVDYRVDPSALLKTYTLNRDRQTMRSGMVLATTFWWDKSWLMPDQRCIAWSRVP